MIVVFYISGHGFGHAARSLEVIKAILGRRPTVRVVIRSAVPSWFFAASASDAIELHSHEVDTGVAQIDSLVLDEQETARRAASFYSTFDARVEKEADVLYALGASLVVGDVPPLAFTASARAGLRSVALANFTWDWIYAAYPAFDRLAPGVVEKVARAYTSVSRALRLPFAGGFEPMADVTRDIPLVGRHARRLRAHTRRVLGLDDRPLVLASFGGHGLRLPYRAIGDRSGLAILTADPETESGEPSKGTDRLKRINRGALDALGLRYEDLVAASDAVVSKPGYGIVSECIANDVALLYTSRGHFPEYDVLVREMPRALRCRFIPQQDLMAGRWSEHVQRLLAQPAPPERMPTNGADVAAEQILELGTC